MWGGVTAALLFSSSARAENASREVSGWYNDGWNAESHASYMANHRVFSEVNPYWYDLGTTSNTTAVNGSISERAYAYTAQNVIDAHANGDLVVPTIADHGAGQIDAIVSNANASRRLIDNIVAVVVSRGYDGFDLNFESGTPKARAQFTAFVSALATALHAKGKRLEVTVQAAASATDEAVSMFDYAALGWSSVDRIKIMAYDHNFDAGIDVPGPIAPIAWIRKVLDYAVVKRGMPRAKIRLGLHNYAWTWRKEGSGWQMLFPHDTFEGVERSSGGTAWQWSANAQESWKQYSSGGKTYRSYVGTADTVAARVALADEYDLAGIAFWVLGREDATIYSRVCASLGGCSKAAPPVLLSRGKPTSASSSFDGYFTPAKAVDGNIVEGWLAHPSEKTSWLSVDLQAAYNLTETQIFWGGHDWPLTYDVQTSNDGRTWNTVYHEANNADGGLDTIHFTGVSSRFVRVLCNGPKSDNWSYEIYDLQVSGTP